MNAKQKKRVIDVIKKDAKLTGAYYWCGDYCVIGGLLKEAGISNDKLKAMDNKSQSDIGRFEWALEILNKEFGIDKDLAEDLQTVNDDHDDTDERVGALLHALETVKVRAS